MIDTSTAGRAFSQPVGIAKGPGENAHEYTFVSRDDAQVLKNGEYVYYELPTSGSTTGEEGPAIVPVTTLPTLQGDAGANGSRGYTRRVLGRILKRVPLQLYPDTFLGVVHQPMDTAAIGQANFSCQRRHAGRHSQPQAPGSAWFGAYRLALNARSRRRARRALR